MSVVSVSQLNQLRLAQVFMKKQQEVYARDQLIFEELGNSLDYYTIFLRAMTYAKRIGYQDPINTDNRGGGFLDTFVDKYCLGSMERKIFDFFEGRGSLGAIGLTDENVLRALKVIKIVDIAVRRCRGPLSRDYANPQYDKATYQVRQRILTLGSPEVTTCQIFTITLSPDKLSQVDHLTQPSSWVNARVAFRAKLFINHQILSRSLSHRLKPIVLATRGNTGVGKSFWITQQIEDSIEDNAQLADGILNPDLIKAVLKNSSPTLLMNQQVYKEGSVFFGKYLEDLITQVKTVGNAIIDTRLLEMDDFDQVLAFACARGAQLELVDVDAPIWTSILSVLRRHPKDKDPCVTFDVIKDGFIKARDKRKEFIYASQWGNVNYHLYRTELNGRPSLVADNKDRDFIHDRQMFEECLRIPTKEEVEAIGDTQITDELIHALDAPPGRKQVLNQWKGYTIKEALRRHAEGKDP